MIRKTVPERAGLSAAQTRDVHYDYDHALGLQTKARFDHLDGEGVSTWYDGFGQVATVSSSMGGAVRYVACYYDDAGNVHSLTHPDGAAFVSDHDALGRVASTYEHRSAASVDDLIVRFGYDAGGSRHAVVRGAGAGGFYTIFYRDPMQRPTIVANDFPSAPDLAIELGVTTRLGKRAWAGR